MNTSEQRSRSEKLRNRERSDAYSGAINNFLSSTGMYSSELARILDVHKSVISDVRAGYRPYGRACARIYLATKAEIFAPRNENEQKTLDDARGNLPLSLSAFLKDGTRPPRNEIGVRVHETKAKKRQNVRGKVRANVQEVASGIINEDDVRPYEPKEGQALVKPDSGMETATGGVIEGQLFNKVLAGIADIKGQVLDGIRFVIPSNRFQRLKGALTQQEVADTVIMVQELRRRLTICTQIDDEELRAFVAHELSSELRELVVAIELMSEVAPSGALERANQMREKMRFLSRESEGRRKGKK